MSRRRSVILLWIGAIGVPLLRSLGPGPALEAPKPFLVADLPAPTQPAALLLGRRIDLNRADAATLELLPGIGPATAQNIVAYRGAHGPFRRVDDLIAVPGVGPGLLRRCAAWVAVSSTP